MQFFFTIFLIPCKILWGKSPRKTKEEMRKNETRYTNYSHMQMENVFLKHVSVEVNIKFCTCNNCRLKIFREGFVGAFGVFWWVWGFFFFCGFSCKFNAVALNSVTVRCPLTKNNSSS